MFSSASAVAPSQVLGILKSFYDSALPIVLHSKRDEGDSGVSHHVLLLPLTSD